MSPVCPDKRGKNECCYFLLLFFADTFSYIGIYISLGTSLIPHMVVLQTGQTTKVILMAMKWTPIFLSPVFFLLGKILSASCMDVSQNSPLEELVLSRACTIMSVSACDVSPFVCLWFCAIYRKKGEKHCCSYYDNITYTYTFSM